MSDILSKYDTSLDGLDQNEVQKRQKEYGLNEIIAKKPTPLICTIFIPICRYPNWPFNRCGNCLLCNWRRYRCWSDNPCGYAECDYGIYPGVQITKGH